MKTDWQQIREMMNTVIDSCEQIETAGFNEEHRSATVEIKGVNYSVQEFLISAWTLPENIRYQIIRERHEAGNNLPYVPEAARILVSMAQACAELASGSSTALGFRVIWMTTIRNSSRSLKLRKKALRRICSSNQLRTSPNAAGCFIAAAAIAYISFTPPPPQPS